MTQYPSRRKVGVRKVEVQDLGYEVLTELPDGRIFTAYWFVAKEGEDPIPEPQCVRHIAGSSFRLS